MNFIINAADAMRDNGKMTIITKHVGDNVVIEFIDNGEGIDEKNLENIFKPFFTTKPTGKGTGLGLSVTAGIIKKHKGTIDVKSKKGEGTTFTITLPVADVGEKLFKKDK